MSMTCYAHNFEDVLLRRALAGVARGVYLDAAAGDPLAGNATQAFYELGWHGVNLEPAPARWRRLCQARPADVNLALAPAAAAGRGAWYELVGGPGADSTRDAALARRHRDAGRDVVEHSVALDTLDAVCSRHFDRDAALHFVKLGAADALAGLDLQRWRPWILVLRADATTALPALTSARYRLAHADGYQQFYVADEHAALGAALALAPHPADDFVLCEDHHYSHPLAALRQRAAAAEADAAASRGWAQDHVREWRQKFERIEAAEQRADLAEREARAAEQRAAAAAQQRAEADGRAEAAEQQRAAAAAALAHMNARADAADAELLGLRPRTAHAEGTLAAIHASVSWRLTRPLREANHLQARARAALRALPGRLARAARRVVRGLAGAALRFVIARPRLSFFLHRHISRLPFMLPMLRTLKMRFQVQQTHNAADAAAAAALPADLDSLPESARQVFDDLRRAGGQPPHQSPLS